MAVVNAITTAHTVATIAAVCGILSILIIAMAIEKAIKNQAQKEKEKVTNPSWHL